MKSKKELFDVYDDSVMLNQIVTSSKINSIRIYLMQNDSRVKVYKDRVCFYIPKHKKTLVIPRGVRRNTTMLFEWIKENITQMKTYYANTNITDRA